MLVGGVAVVKPNQFYRNMLKYSQHCNNHQAGGIAIQKIYASCLTALRFADDGEYRLSVLDIDDEENFSVTHYKIKHVDGNYTIDAEDSFSTIFGLINYYKGKKIILQP